MTARKPAPKKPVKKKRPAPKTGIPARPFMKDGDTITIRSTRIPIGTPLGEMLRKAFHDGPKALFPGQQPPAEPQGFVPDPKYTSLYNILKDAYEQAAGGKGKERHAHGLPFEEQPMQAISSLLHSPEGLRWQAIKKVQEAHSMLLKARAAGDPELVATAKAFHRKEMLGAINYIAGAILFEDQN